LTYKATRR